MRAENVLCPAVYTYRKLGSGHTCLNLSQPYNWSDSTIANILENETYLGNTVNMKFTTKSYKDKRYVQHPREECLVFEGTHQALIAREVWDIVQRVRQNRKRPTKMEELNKYSGLVICADCGSTMVLHRARTMKPTQNNFTCRTYKKAGPRGLHGPLHSGVCPRRDCAGGHPQGDGDGAGAYAGVRRLYL